MVLALAHARSVNATYGGACYAAPVADEQHADRVGLIGVLGLGRVLRFGCPDNGTRPAGELISDKLYLRRGRSLITMPFVEWLRSQSRADHSAGEGRSDAAAVVHIRRGDVDLCGTYRDRYLPSSYYTEIVERYIPPNVSVAVYSEKESFEPWSVFGAPNYALRLDTSLIDAWRAVAAARYVVFSLSTFVYLPALLNRNGTVLYTPTSHFAPLPHWIAVSEEIRARARSRLERLVAERCPNTNNASAAGAGAVGQKA
jgi:hypothetical protein